MDLLYISDFSSNKEFKNKVCEICVHAKQTRDVFPISSNKTSVPFDLIRCNLWGPYRVQSHSGARYFITIVDDYTRIVWLFVLSTKNEVMRTIKDFVTMVEQQFAAKVKTVRSDNGTEFVCMTSYFREKGIIHEISCVGTP